MMNNVNDTFSIHNNSNYPYAVKRGEIAQIMKTAYLKYYDLNHRDNITVNPNLNPCIKINYTDLTSVHLKNSIM